MIISKSSDMKLITSEILDNLTEQALHNVRLRMNYNLHKKESDPVQKLFNALEPGTDLPVHRHEDIAETYIVVRGSLNLILYNCDREVLETIEVNPTKGVYGVDIPAGMWHTVEALEHGTIIFEVKEGPYKPMESDDLLEK